MPGTYAGLLGGGVVSGREGVVYSRRGAGGRLASMGRRCHVGQGGGDVGRMASLVLDQSLLDPFRGGVSTRIVWVWV